MPVTAKLSKACYDQLGEQIANELVEWFNQVDLTYRNELREFNELNFQRFAARMDERIGASEAKVEVRFSQLEQRMSAIEATLERRLASHTRWMFAVWAALFIPIIGLWFRG